jgi:DNA mismatch endonuclease, patch repair protein
VPEKISKEQRSKLMAKIRSKDTKCELTLRRSLREAGLKGYRVNYNELKGTPDVVFLKKRLAIFCDSDFWHGKKNLPSSNRNYWQQKLQRNMARDLAVNRELTESGWNVLRFSEKEVLKDSDSCVKKIKDALSANTPTDPQQTKEKSRKAS